MNYTIKEIIPDKNIDINMIQDSVSREYNDLTIINKINEINELEMSSCIFAQQMEYSINYTIKHISYIMDYYKLSKHKLCKDKLIEKLVDFEIDETNKDIVERRKELWNYAKELKKDEYFSKLLLFNC